MLRILVVCGGAVKGDGGVEGSARTRKLLELYVVFSCRLVYSVVKGLVPPLPPPPLVLLPHLVPLPRTRPIMFLGSSRLEFLLLARV